MRTGRAGAYGKVFEEETKAGLLKLGAKQDAEKPWQWTMPTVAGILTLRVYEDWIAGRFSKPEVAKQLLCGYPGARMNSTTGAWNFHFSQEQTGPHAAAAFFLGELRDFLARNRRRDGK